MKLDCWFQHCPSNTLSIVQEFTRSFHTSSTCSSCHADRENDSRDKTQSTASRGTAAACFCFRAFVLKCAGATSMPDPSTQQSSCLEAARYINRREILLSAVIHFRCSSVGQRGVCKLFLLLQGIAKQVLAKLVTMDLQSLRAILIQ